MAACQSQVIAPEKARSPLQEVIEMHFQGSITAGCTDSRDDQFFKARADRHNLSPHNKKCWGRFQERKKTMHRIQFHVEPHTS
jgi:hypothetical protein